jgi:hypothetical protein
MSDKKLEEEIMAMFANTRMEEQRSYLVRGRKFHAEESSKLISCWLVQINAWADDKDGFDPQFMNDVEAELRLRGIDAPADQAGDAVKKLSAKSRALTEKWTPEEALNAEESIQRDLAKLRPSKIEKN